ncbi:MAG: hypothetical protein K2I63_01755 [Helicobacter sp.]|nr:hypothetical protein [Helicobacter sp.]
MVKEIVGFKGDLKFNIHKPDSSMDRLMDISKIQALGWQPKIQLKKGIEMMYQWYKKCSGGGGKNEILLPLSIANSCFKDFNAYVMEARHA